MPPTTGCPAHWVLKTAAKEHKYGTVHVEIPTDSDPYDAIEEIRSTIDPDDLAGEGMDLGPTHITVRYGLDSEDTEGIVAYLSGLSPFEVQFGATASFPPSESSDNAAVLIAPVKSAELTKMNSELARHGKFTEPSFKDYKAHATIAYLKPEAVTRYEGRVETEGQGFRVEAVTVITKDNGESIVPLMGGKKQAAGSTDSPAFQSWFRDSKVVDAQGNPKRVYRGDYRGDRVGDKFKVNRSTSGRFYFTDDPEIASSYATGKPDYGHNEENQNYENWYRFPQYKYPREREAPDLKTVWYRLPQQVKEKIKQVALSTGMDDEGEIAFDRDGPVSSQDNMEREARKHGGNWLMALADPWLYGGVLFNDEKQFVKILERCGLEPAFDNPSDPRSMVTPVYLSIQNPLDTAAIPQKVIDQIRAMAKADRTRAKGYGVDQWDKGNLTPKEWVARFDEDLKNGTSYAWTTMPEKVTKVLESMGYDGIKDTGGKRGGVQHTVWIAFYPNQIKSALGNKGTFNPDKDSILASVHQAKWESAVSMEPGDHEVKIGDARMLYKVIPDKKLVEFYNLRVSQPKRHQGSARAAMEAFTAALDEAGYTGRLVAYALDKRTSTGRLVEFYRGLGFNTTEGDPWMSRAPQSKQAGRRRRYAEPPAPRDPQIDTPAFQAWFKGSVVCDPDGDPITVHHGSPDARFLKEHGKFQTQRERWRGPGESPVQDDDDHAFWFTPDRDTAASYADERRAWDYQNAEGGVHSFYLSMKNPLVVDHKGERWQGKTQQSVVEAKKNGHDGIIVKNVIDDYHADGKNVTTTYAVFDSSQIKAVKGNSGEFSPDNKSVYGSSKRAAELTGKGIVYRGLTPGGRPSFGKVMFVTQDPEGAAQYGDVHSYEIDYDRERFLSIDSPEARELVEQATGERLDDDQDYDEVATPLFAFPDSGWVRMLEAKGYTGTRYGHEFAVFHPESLREIKQAAGDLVDWHPILREFMAVLKPGLPDPEIKIVNTANPSWLGRCNWYFQIAGGLPSRDQNTVIELQKAILRDEETVRRVLAHELCHHEDNLVNLGPEFDREVTDRSSYMAFQRKVNRDGTKGHGAQWKAIAARFNGKYGADFVTPKSDESYVVEHDEREFFVALEKSFYPKARWFAHALRLTNKQVDRLKGGYTPWKIVKTTDRDFMTAKLGNGWDDAARKGLEEKWQSLWDNAEVIASGNLDKEPEWEQLETRKTSHWLFMARPTEQKIQILKDKMGFDDEQVEQIIACDPSPNQSEFVQWIAKQVKQNLITLPEDTQKIHGQLQQFLQLKRSPRFEGNKDIGGYTPAKLYSTIEENTGNVSKKQEVRTLKEEGGQGAKQILNQDGIQVFEVTDTRQLMRLSSNTNWCTTQEVFAEDYLAKGPNYIVYKDGKPYAQWDPDSNQLMDVEDVEMRIGEFDDCTVDPVINAVKKALPVQFKKVKAKSVDPEKIDSPREAVAYAESVLKGRFPEKEALIATDAKSAVKYAENVIKGRFPEGESLIATDASSAVDYAENVLKGPFPAGEESISKYSDVAANYAIQVLHGPFKKGEPEIIKNAVAARMYACDALHGPFPAGEDIIATKALDSYAYATEAIKGPFPKGEPIIATDPTYAALYVKDVTHAPFPAGEEAIATEGRAAYMYAKALNQPFPAGEIAIAKDGPRALNYAQEVLKAPFPLGEDESFLKYPNIKSSIEYANWLYDNFPDYYEGYFDKRIKRVTERKEKVGGLMRRPTFKTPEDAIKWINQLPPLDSDPNIISMDHFLTWDGQASIVDNFRLLDYAASRELIEEAGIETVQKGQLIASQEHLSRSTLTYFLNNSKAISSVGGDLPVLLLKTGLDYYIFDGHHRIVSQLLLGAKSIQGATVTEGTIEEALLAW